LLVNNPQRAQTELQEIRQTARIALKEVREMVTEMRGTRLVDEIFRVRQIFHAADIELTLEGDPDLRNTSLMTENVLSMCLKEAVTNVVKHARADEIAAALAAAGHGQKAYYRTPVHRQPAMRQWGEGAELPVTDAIAATHLAIPLSPLLTAEQAAEVTATIRAALA